MRSLSVPLENRNGGFDGGFIVCFIKDANGLSWSSMVKIGLILPQLLSSDLKRPQMLTFTSGIIQSQM